MYYVFDGAEMHYFDSKFLATLFFNVGRANESSTFVCLWELGLENMENGYGVVLANSERMCFYVKC